MTNPDPRCGAAPDVGLLLIGHGSRAADGVDEFLATSRVVTGLAAPWLVEPCFLEFAEPTIATGFERLAGRGVERVVVAPVMLFAAAHIRRDIPAAVAAAAVGAPGLPRSQAEHLGDHPAIVESSKSRYEEVLQGRPSVAAGETVLVMVGRGSHDREATDEMVRFGHARRALSPGLRVETGFVAMADPPLESVLGRAAKSGARRIVVQPHLLFGGVLLARIAATVERFAREHAEAEWLVAGHLGPSEFVARAIVDRACQALPQSGARAASGTCTA